MFLVLCYFIVRWYGYRFIFRIGHHVMFDEQVMSQWLSVPVISMLVFVLVFVWAVYWNSRR